jgi:hypothetical protein
MDLPTKPPTPRRKWPRRFQYLAMVIVPGAIVLLAWGDLGVELYARLSRDPRLDTREYLGTVQRISYIGGLGIHTQIDTETRTVLLRGAVLTQRGARLELRRLAWGPEVCNLDRVDCHALVDR